MTGDISSQLKKFLEALSVASEKHKQSELNPSMSFGIRFYEPLETDRGNFEKDLSIAISGGVHKALAANADAVSRAVIGLDVDTILSLLNRALALGHAIGAAPFHETAEISADDMLGFVSAFPHQAVMDSWKNCHLQDTAVSILVSFVYTNLSSIQLAGKDLSAFRDGVVSALSRLGVSPNIEQITPEITAPDGSIH